MLTCNHNPFKALRSDERTAAGKAARAHHNDVDKIREITEATIRLPVRIPLRSNGQLTVKALAEEAGFRRNKLTHKRTRLGGGGGLDRTSP